MNLEMKYCDILGTTSLPESPNVLPQNVYLPSESLGDLERVVFDTLDKNREFSQAIYWSEHGFRNSNISKGDQYSVEGWKRRVLTYFGRKPLLHYHTHTVFPGWELEPEWEAKGLIKTYEIERFDFSQRDIATSVSSPRESYIELCAAPTGVSAMLRTRKSTKLPVSQIKRLDEVEKKLINMEFVFLSKPERACILAELGFGYYVWQPRQRSIQLGELQSGIELRKVS